MQTEPSQHRSAERARAEHLRRSVWFACSLLLLAAPAFAQGSLAGSPADPIAGNPNSLQSKMLNADYIGAFAGPFVPKEPETRRFEATEDWVRTEADFSYWNAQGIRGESYDVGMSYGLNLPARRLALLFDVPIALTRSDSGGLSYMGSAGVGLNIRMTPSWNLTPMLRVGVAGTRDIDGAVVLYSGTLVSTAKWKLKGFDVALVNVFGVESNVRRVEPTGTPLDYDMTVGLFQNGFTVGKPIRTRIFGKRMRWNAFYRLANFVGKDVFLENQHQAGLRYSTGGHADGLTLEVGWAGGPDYDSARIRLVARF